MEMLIENITNTRVAFMRNVGEYGIKNYQLMEKVKGWAKEKKLYNSEMILFGIAHDNPEITPSEQCRYDVCVVIPNDYPIDSPISEETIQGGKYAVFKIRHTAEAIEDFWKKIFIALQQYHFQLDTNKPILERYAVKYLEKGYCEFCVPIVSN